MKQIYPCKVKADVSKEDKRLVLQEAKKWEVSEAQVIRSLIKTLKKK